jgi:hypothetical protein
MRIGNPAKLDAASLYQVDVEKKNPRRAPKSIRIFLAEVRIYLWPLTLSLILQAEAAFILGVQAGRFGALFCKPGGI